MLMHLDFGTRRRPFQHPVAARNGLALRSGRVGALIDRHQTWLRIASAIADR